MKLQVIIQKSEDGCYVVHCPSLRSCWSQGKTKEECLKNLSEAIELILEDRRQDTLRGIPNNASSEMVAIG